MNVALGVVAGIVEFDGEFLVQRSDFSLKNYRNGVFARWGILILLVDRVMCWVRSDFVQNRLEGPTECVVDVRLGDVGNDNVKQRLAGMVVVVLRRVVVLLLVFDQHLLAKRFYFVQQLNVVDFLAEDDRSYLFK